MAQTTGIEWTEATWNPIVGCSVVSPGCTNCYAMRRVAPRLAANPATPHYAGTVKPSKAGPVWTGKIGIAPDSVLTAPLRWKRPRRIFVNSVSDLFHEDVPDVVIDRIFAVMALCPQHTFQVLTKRSARMRAYLDTCRDSKFEHIVAASRALNWFVDTPGDGCYLDAWWPGWPLPNVWLGVSVEDQTRAEERIPDLLATPATVRWISAEPLLGAINLRRIRVAPDHHTMIDALDGYGIASTPGHPGRPERTMLNWVVAGGESGKGARPMHPDWARSLRDQCAAAGVPFLFKQWGDWSCHEIGSDGTVAPTIPLGSSWNRVRRFDGSLFREAGKGESAASFMAAGVLAVPAGKKAAGRLLDDVLHDAYPQVSA